MGWMFFAVSQVLVTSTVLGALKRTGAIELNTGAVKNDAARRFLVLAVDVGENVATQVERVYTEVTAYVQGGNK